MEDEPQVYSYSYEYEEERIPDYSDECFAIAKRLRTIRHTKRQRLHPHHPAIYILCILLFLVIIIQIPKQTLFLNIATVLVLVIFYLAIWIVWDFLLKHLTRRRFKEMKGQTGILKISEEGIEDRTATVVMKFSLNEIVKVVVGRDVIMFITKSKIYMYVSRMSPQDKELITVLQTYFPQRLLYWQYG